MYSQGYSDNNGSNALIKIALPAVVLFQVVTCFFIPTNYERAGEWIPLFSGFWDMDIVMTAGMKSIIYGIASAVLLLLSLYILNDKLFSSISKSFTTVAVAATLIFCNPMAVYFTSIYPAAICIVWSLYCLLTAQIFLAFFLISLASMFFAPLILTIPNKMMRSCFDDVYLGMNHSKVMLISNSRYNVSVVTSQNQTYGDRADSTILTTSHDVFTSLYKGFSDTVNFNSVKLNGDYSRTVEEGGESE